MMFYSYLDEQVEKDRVDKNELDYSIAVKWDEKLLYAVN